MSSLVVAEPLTLTPDRLIEQFEKSFQIIGLDRDFANAKAVFIKPNLTYPTYKKGVTTRVEFISSLVTALRKINSSTTIYIGEGEGGYNSFSMSDAMKTMGFFDIKSAHENVEIINLSQVPRSTVELHANGGPYFVELPAILTHEIDFAISCPLPKVHCMTRITLSYKNQWGCLPDVMRLKNHYVFDQIISQVAEKLKFRYAFLDGRYGLDDNGPMVGTPVELDWFVASNSLGAFDMIVSEMMGFNWRHIGHLKCAALNGCMPKREDIQITGDIDKLKRQFRLKRDMWNYPALAAFRSKNLTHLVYFSVWSKLLHDVMYTFRRRPIDT